MNNKEWEKFGKEWGRYMALLFLQAVAGIFALCGVILLINNLG